MNATALNDNVIRGNFSNYPNAAKEQQDFTQVADKIGSNKVNNQTAQDNETKVAVSAVNEAKESEELDAKELEKQLSKIQEEIQEKQDEQISNSLNRQNIGLNFSLDKDTDYTVVKVTDLNTKEMVRQIPSADFLKLAKHLDDMRNETQVKSDGTTTSQSAKGLIFDVEA